MVRPSYVLGGRAMEIVYNEDELRDYMNRAVKVTPDHPVLIDHYMQGTEVEVDAIADGETVVIPGIMNILNVLVFTLEIVLRYILHRLYLLK